MDCDHKTDSLGVPIGFCPACRKANAEWQAKYWAEVMQGNSQPDLRPISFDRPEAEWPEG